MAEPRVEKAYEKHAWIFLFVWGILWLLYGFFLFIIPTPELSTPFESIAGIPWSELVASSPRVANVLIYLTRGFGVLALVASIFFIAVAAKSYRRGERWAWYTAWSLPVLGGTFLALDVSSGAGGSYALFYDALFLILPLAGLLLPYRKFFPKKQVAPS